MKERIIEAIKNASVITISTTFEYCNKKTIENKMIDIMTDHENGTRDCYKIRLSRTPRKLNYTSLEHAYLTDYNSKKSSYQTYLTDDQRHEVSKSDLKVYEGLVDQSIQTMDLCKYSRPGLMTYFKKGLLKSN